MAALLLAAALAAPVDASGGDPYATDALYTFVAVANDRVVDGIPYADGNGLLSAGGSWVHPSGFFASLELDVFQGDGKPLPDEAQATSQLAAGWGVHAGGNRFSLALVDYRIFVDDSPGSSQAVSLEYRRSRFAATLGFERDRPYYLYGSFLHTDARRLSIAWTQPVNDSFSWYAGAGALELSYHELRHEYIGAGIFWEWQGLEWQAGVTVAGDDLAYLAGDDVSDAQLLLRASRSFRLR